MGPEKAKIILTPGKLKPARYVFSPSNDATFAETTLFYYTSVPTTMAQNIGRHPKLGQYSCQGEDSKALLALSQRASSTTLCAPTTYCRLEAESAGHQREGRYPRH